MKEDERERQKESLTDRPATVIDGRELDSRQEFVPELLYIRTLRVTTADSTDHDVVVRITA